MRGLGALMVNLYCTLLRALVVNLNCILGLQCLTCNINIVTRSHWCSWTRQPKALRRGPTEPVHNPATFLQLGPVASVLIKLSFSWLDYWLTTGILSAWFTFSYFSFSDSTVKPNGQRIHSDVYHHSSKVYKEVTVVIIYKHRREWVVMIEYSTVKTGWAFLSQKDGLRDSYNWGKFSSMSRSTIAITFWCDLFNIQKPVPNVGDQSKTCYSSPFNLFI